MDCPHPPRNSAPGSCQGTTSGFEPALSEAKGAVSGDADIPPRRAPRLPATPKCCGTSRFENRETKATAPPRKALVFSFFQNCFKCHADPPAVHRSASAEEAQASRGQIENSPFCRRPHVPPGRPACPLRDRRPPETGPRKRSRVSVRSSQAENSGSLEPSHKAEVTLR